MGYQDERDGRFVKSRTQLEQENAELRKQRIINKSIYTTKKVQEVLKENIELHKQVEHEKTVVKETFEASQRRIRELNDKLANATKTIELLKTTSQSAKGGEMKSILISIQPKWVEKILNGEKTIEIRKTAPKCELPIDVYIYCTKDESNVLVMHSNGETAIATRGRWKSALGCYNDINGKVVAKFTLKYVDKYENIYILNLNNNSFGTERYERRLAKAGLLTWEAEKYAAGKDLYFWHISDLQVFDKPKELGEFKPYCKLRNNGCHLNRKQCFNGQSCNTIERPPQSWQFVEVSQ